MGREKSISEYARAAALSARKVEEVRVVAIWIDLRPNDFSVFYQSFYVVSDLWRCTFNNAFAAL